MFKRVAKRNEKGKGGQRLDMTGGKRKAMKHVKKSQSTSSSSGSSSDDGQTISSLEVEVFKETENKKRKHVDAPEGSSGEGSEMDSGTSEVQDDAPTLTIKEALNDPVYSVDSDKLDIRACVICPGKILKNPTMEKSHYESAHHRRRFMRFKQAVERLSTKFDDVHSDSASLIVRLLDQNGPDMTKSLSLSNNPKMSNRAKKRLALKSHRNQRKGKKRKLLEGDQK